ncbi:MAG: twin-arginine translocation signal domain-containing protein [Chloroflexota bacterium]|nr:twin-arginine translocation signal domain-containing protein [Chloroflexota bacterium]MBI5703643.1 twin-arginine translocation signal domain-containing protein [Chloroflexota bacterium]
MSSQKLSRREALKLLAAATGAAALSTLPPAWSKPDLQMGVLPVHAQTSAGIHTVTAGASDPAANYCFPLISTATITPPTPGIVMRYNITTSGTPPTVTSPAALTGTVVTDGKGSVSLTINVDTTPGAFDFGDIISVTWSFDNPADGSGSDVQTFMSDTGGC